MALWGEPAQLRPCMTADRRVYGGSSIPAMSSPPVIIMEWRPSKKASPAGSFLDLPLEIRELVYAHAFDLRGGRILLDVDTSPPQVPAGQAARLRGRWLEGDDAIHITPLANLVAAGLLRTCRQIYVESMPFLCRGKPFRIDDMACVDLLAPQLRGYMQHLEFTLNSNHALVKQMFLRSAYLPACWAIFWPDVRFKTDQLMPLFPKLESLTFAVPRGVYTWVLRMLVRSLGPAAADRAQRVQSMAEWLKKHCLPPMTNPQARLLRLGIFGPGQEHYHEQEERKFLLGFDDHCSEFAEAFERTKGLCS